MAMNQRPKVPADKVDALAQDLQGNLKRGRPQRWRLTLTALAGMGLLALLAWWLYNPALPPPLAVVAFDTVVRPDETPSVVAQVAFAREGEHAPALLQGRELLFFYDHKLMQPGRGPAEPEAVTVSDPDGRGTVTWPAVPQGHGERVAVRLLESGPRQQTLDRALVVPWDPQRPILLVDVEDALCNADESALESMSAADVKVQPQAFKALKAAAQKDYQIGYVSVSASNPLAYFRVRGWLQLNQLIGLPPGPALGRRVYSAAQDPNQARRDLLQDLKARFGDKVTLIARSPGVVDAARIAGVRVAVLGRKELGQGVVGLDGWADLMTALSQLPGE
jgi:hypothetical protein